MAPAPPLAWASISMKITGPLTAVCFALTTLPITVTTSFGQAHTKGKAVTPFSQTLKPGEYDWHPEFSPRGPVVVLVSIPDQLLYVYRNGIRIARSTVSSGKSGKETPTGVFTVLQKKVKHESSIFKGAQMPHMQRLTWTGIALHAGHLPGYPASAGCVRLPVDFASRLYTVTTMGTTVIIADHRSAPTHTVRPGLLFSGKTGTHPNAAYTWQPGKAPNGPVSVIFSTPDQQVYVYRNGVEIGRARVYGLASTRVAGTYAYSADRNLDANGRRDWIAIAAVGRRAPNLLKFESQINVDPTFMQNVRSTVTAGSTLVVTNTPVNQQTQSSSGFSILAASGR
jgi:L,D-transpeptidase catalytic domain